MGSDFVLRWSPSFKRMFKEKDTVLREKVEKRLIFLSKNDPYRTGSRKKGLHYGISPYGMKVDKSNRIVYDIQEENGKKVIYLLKVCDHKEVGFRE